MANDLSSTLHALRSRHPNHYKALDYVLAGLDGKPRREKPLVVIKRFQEEILDLCVDEPEHAKMLVLAAELISHPPQPQPRQECA